MQHPLQHGGNAWQIRSIQEIARVLKDIFLYIMKRLSVADALLAN